MRSRLTSLAAALTIAALATTSCSLVGGDDDDGEAGDAGDAEVVLVTHESFHLPDELIVEFEKESGYQLETRSTGDAGELTNKLVLTKDNPTGDVAFGVDNTFATRALDEGVFETSDVEWPAGVDTYALPGDDDHALTPVDNGNVCVNIDDTWFEREGIAPPETLEDLTEPAYEGLFVTPAATTSSPGMAFLLSTVAAYGEGWPDYWADLMDNGVELTDGWSTAYQVEFTQGGGKGDRPIVVSYDSSPAFTVSDGRSTTSALLDTCFRQVEYAGVLKDAKNPEGARAFIDFMTHKSFQQALPENMYVYPVDRAVALPADWAKYARTAPKPFTVPPAEVAENRSTWLSQWSDITTR
jgi:thiamine transport system substrate-binding protein